MSEEIVLSDRNVPRPSLQEELTRLYSQGFLTDITLSTEDGKNFEAHRVLLAARSTYFSSVVPRLKAEPVIFLKGVKGAHLDKILKFIYGSSVSVSKHQLKPILEVAKSLQVKGLQDVTPAEILSRQSVVSAGRFKPDSPLASPLLTSTSVSAAAAAAAASKHSQQHTRSTPSSISTSATFVDKTTLTTFKSPTGRRPGKSAAALAASRLGQQQQQQHDSPVASDAEDKVEEEAAAASTSEGGVETRTRKRRGRPPKKAREDAKAAAASSKDSKVNKEDVYEFEEDSNDAGDNPQSGDENSKKGWRYQSGERKKKSKGSKENHADEEEEGSSPVPEDENMGKKGRGNTINGKEVLTVSCKEATAELYVSKFLSGNRGRSIKFTDQWVTPDEFATLCGYAGKKYLDNIQTDYGPLKALIASGMLKSHPRSLRRREESPKGSSTQEKKAKKRSRRDDEAEEEEEAEEEKDEDREEESEQDTSKDRDEEEPQQQPETNDASTYTTVKGSAKRKKRKHRDEWKRQLLKNEANAAAAAAAAAASTVSSTGAMGSSDPLNLNEEQPPYIQAEKGDTLAAAATMMATSMDQPPKISPSAIITTDHHQQQQQQPPPPQPQTLYVMSPHPSIAPATPQHNPFANAMSPAPQQLTYQTMSSQPITTAQVSYAGNATGGGGSSGGGNGGGGGGGSNSLSGSGSGKGASGFVSRIGNILNVRCKSTTAQLYANKYESGSKGKCIQLGDEWLTPNEFEDRAGSKAKKYLSSIKCMGRPLRVYVNSGELRGTGPPPPPKGSKGSGKKALPPQQQQSSSAPPLAPSTPHPIAPAPIQAPPTPSHISSAPAALPPNLNMMMGGQPPILINQTSMASSMMNQPNILPAMTFTIAQPLASHSQTM